MQGWRSNTAVAVGAAVVWLPGVTRRHTSSLLSHHTAALPPHHTVSLHPSGDLTSPHILNVPVNDRTRGRSIPQRAWCSLQLTQEMWDWRVEANNAQIGLFFFSPSQLTSLHVFSGKSYCWPGGGARYYWFCIGLIWLNLLLWIIASWWLGASSHLSRAPATHFDPWWWEITRFMSVDRSQCFRAFPHPLWMFVCVIKTSIVFLFFLSPFFFCLTELQFGEPFPPLLHVFLGGFFRRGWLQC